MTRIAVLDDFQGRAVEFADWGGLDVTFIREHLLGDALIAALAGSEVVVAMRERTAFPAPLIDALPELRLLITTGASNASIDVAAARRNGVVVCGTGGGSTSTTETTWALLLGGMNNLASEDAAIRRGQWQLRIPRQLAGKRLGLIGLGRLGSAMVPIARAFSMEVRAWSQNLSAERAAAVGVHPVSKEELLRTSDVVSIHLKLSERTRGLLSAADLALMRPGALLVNTSRGPIVDEGALADALRADRIYAALDVYDTEPLPAGHPFTELDNVLLAPHLGYVGEDNFRTMFGDAVEDIHAFLAGTPVRVIS